MRTAKPRSRNPLRDVHAGRDTQLRLFDLTRFDQGNARVPSPLADFEIEDRVLFPVWRDGDGSGTRQAPQAGSVHANLPDVVSGVRGGVVWEIRRRGRIHD